MGCFHSSEVDPDTLKTEPALTGNDFDNPRMQARLSWTGGSDYYQQPKNPNKQPRLEIRSQPLRNGAAESYHEAIKSINRSAAPHATAMPQKTQTRDTTGANKRGCWSKEEENRPAHGFNWPVGSYKPPVHRT